MPAVNLFKSFAAFSISSCSNWLDSGTALIEYAFIINKRVCIFLSEITANVRQSAMKLIKYIFVALYLYNYEYA